MYACIQGYPPSEATLRQDKDRIAVALSRMRGIYSDNLIEVVEWCMALDPLSRPQSVFALQKELSRDVQRQHTKPSLVQRVGRQMNNLVADARKSLRAVSTDGKIK
jgi:serine/threonine protein kinase